MKRTVVWIVVSAVDHPDLDDWVWDQARAEAATSQTILGAYLGREDVLPPPRPADLCCHVFETTTESSDAHT